MGGWAGQERAALVELMTALGPDAPTLCGGWTTADLAAHLYVRERRPDAAAGVIVPGPFATYTDRVMASVLRVHGYAAVVQKVAAGPPRYLRPANEALNLFEFFVHHEDVRRANGENPRTLPVEMERVMWTRLRRMLRIAYRRLKGVQVEFVTSHGDRTVIGSGPTARLFGAASEIALYSFDRKTAAEVEVTGDADAVEALGTARLGP